MHYPTLLYRAALPKYSTEPFYFSPSTITLGAMITFASASINMILHCTSGTEAKATEPKGPRCTQRLHRSLPPPFPFPPLSSCQSVDNGTGRNTFKITTNDEKQKSKEETPVRTTGSG